MTIVVRALVEDDEDAWRELWRGYLTFYETNVAEAVTRQTFARLVGDRRFVGLGAADGPRLVGFAHGVIHPSTGAVGDRCYLQDLFVDPSARRLGAARALLTHLYEIADNNGWDRVYWTTHKDNAGARALYDGLAKMSDFVQYRR